jgi:hypothetical protein
MLQLATPQFLIEAFCSCGLAADIGAKRCHDRGYEMYDIIILL